MTFDRWDGDDEAATGRFVPLYVLVNGRTSPRDSNLDLATQVIALAVDTRRLEPEYLQIVNRCGNWISIAEIGAYLHLPLAITKVMVDVLLEQGKVQTIGSVVDVGVQRIGPAMIFLEIVDTGECGADVLICHAAQAREQRVFLVRGVLGSGFAEVAQCAVECAANFRVQQPAVERSY